MAANLLVIIKTAIIEALVPPLTDAGDLLFPVYICERVLRSRLCLSALNLDCQTEYGVHSLSSNKRSAGFMLPALARVPVVLAER
jgi:hypothetical protein